jgi:formylglycine-generating enzyme required for sulfatase activity
MENKDMHTTPSFPPVFPFQWASSWGEDNYGLFQEFEYKGTVQRMRWISPGRFMMGSPKDEPEREPWDKGNEKQHQVILTHGFWLADTTCTQELWQAVMGNNPSRFKDSLQNPVEQVSWNMICETGGFLDRINKEIPGLNLQLPTEAQWEYACRAGTTTPFCWGNELTTDKANYDGNYPYNNQKKGEYRAKPVPVKNFQRNPLGLCQMHGNVWEWCSDWYATDLTKLITVDPEGPDNGSFRVLRGGSWCFNGQDLRSALRYINAPSFAFDFYGFRLSRGHQEQEEPEQKEKVNEAERSDQGPLARQPGEEERSRAAAAGGRTIFEGLTNVFAPKKRGKK